MVGDKTKITSNEGKEYLLLEKYCAYENATYYEVYEWSAYETYGTYMGDFNSKATLGSVEFCNELSEWIKNEL
jgi:hypothetical protein